MDSAEPIALWTAVRVLLAGEELVEASVPICCASLSWTTPVIAFARAVTKNTALELGILHDNFACEVVRTIVAIFAALSVNMVIMLYAKNIGKVMSKLNMLSALVRIIGLIIATFGIQMIFDGISGFMKLHGITLM